MISYEYAIEEIDPTVVYIVTIDDIPVQLPSAEVYTFLRRKDAERWIDNHKRSTAALNSQPVVEKNLSDNPNPKKTPKEKKKNPGLD